MVTDRDTITPARQRIDGAFARLRIHARADLTHEQVRDDLGVVLDALVESRVALTAVTADRDHWLRKAKALEIAHDKLADTVEAIRRALK